MKKIIFTLAILTSLALMSCKKNRTCSCEKTTKTNGLVGEFPVIDSLIENASKKDASEICNNGDMQFAFGNTTTTISCELK